MVKTLELFVNKLVCFLLFAREEKGKECIYVQVI